MLERVDFQKRVLNFLNKDIKLAQDAGSTQFYITTKDPEITYLLCRNSHLFLNRYHFFSDIDRVTRIPLHEEVLEEKKREVVLTVLTLMERIPLYLSNGTVAHSKFSESATVLSKEFCDELESYLEDYGILDRMINREIEMANSLRTELNETMNIDVIGMIRHDVELFRKQDSGAFTVLSPDKNTAYLLAYGKTTGFCRYRKFEGLSGATRTDLNVRVSGKQRIAIFNEIKELIRGLASEALVSKSEEFAQYDLGWGPDAFYIPTKRYVLKLEEILNKYSILDSMKRKEEEMKIQKEKDWKG